MQGRKPDLNKDLRYGNVAQFPGGNTRAPADAPTDAHREKALELRPKFLTAAERKVWDEQAPLMVMLGRLRPHHALAFADLCQIESRLRAWRKKLDAAEWTYVTTGRNGAQHKMRPEVGQLNDDWRKRHSLRAEFGMTPAAERGLAGAGQGDLFDESWAQV